MAGADDNDEPMEVEILPSSSGVSEKSKSSHRTSHLPW